jgi:hypothetical protein
MYKFTLFSQNLRHAKKTRIYGNRRKVMVGLRRIVRNVERSKYELYERSWSVVGAYSNS